MKPKLENILWGTVFLGIFIMYYFWPTQEALIEVENQRLYQITDEINRLNKGGKYHDLGRSGDGVSEVGVSD
jgi:hypothetical protein